MDRLPAVLLDNVLLDVQRRIARERVPTATPNAERLPTRRTGPFGRLILPRHLHCLPTALSVRRFLQVHRRAPARPLEGETGPVVAGFGPSHEGPGQSQSTRLRRCVMVYQLSHCSFEEPGVSLDLELFAESILIPPSIWRAACAAPHEAGLCVSCASGGRVAPWNFDQHSHPKNQVECIPLTIIYGRPKEMSRAAFGVLFFFEFRPAQ